MISPWPNSITAELVFVLAEQISRFESIVLYLRVCQAAIVVCKQTLAGPRVNWLTLW